MIFHNDKLKSKNLDRFFICPIRVMGIASYDLFELQHEKKSAKVESKWFRRIRELAKTFVTRQRHLLKAYFAANLLSA